MSRREMVFSVIYLSQLKNAARDVGESSALVPSILPVVRILMPKRALISQSGNRVGICEPQVHILRGTVAKR